MRAIVVQVEHGDAVPYLCELYLMGPYRLAAAFESATHRVFVLASQPEFPRLIVMEPLTVQYQDEITLLNSLYPLAAAKPNARYVGEIFAASDQSEVRRILESHSIRFNYHHETKNPLITDSAFAFSFPSDYTGNRLGYCQVDFDDLGALGLGQPIQLPSETRSQLDAVDEFSQGQRLTPLVMGLDHMAT